jgi:hypothetical protein
LLGIVSLFVPWPERRAILTGMAELGDDANRPPRDPGKAAALERWLRQVETAFERRVLSIDNAVPDQWGRMCAIRPIPVIDCLLAATAVINGLTLVTGNDRDIAGLGAEVLNPFRSGENYRRS